MSFIPESETTAPNLFDLTGKVALISGASGFLGSAMSRALAEAGANVVVSSRSAETAQKVANQLPAKEGQNHFGVELNHLEESSIHSGFQDAVEKAGQVDILINNGHAPLGEDWKSVTFDQFKDHQINLAGYFELSRLTYQHAVERKVPASIVLLGSMYGVVGSYPETYEGVCKASPAPYHGLKGGIVHLTRHLAVYWAETGVRVNCISPGPFPNETAPEEMVKRLCEKSPMKRMGQPHELKGAVVFLASDASSYITGQNLLIDGGWTAW